METLKKRLVSLTNDFNLLSQDSDTKVSCVIVRTENNEMISFGVNKFPNGCTVSDDRLKRPDKYNWMIHAEEYAISYAAKNGIKLDGSTMYLNWFPCARCAGLIINSGIKELICDISRERDKKYEKEFKISEQKLIEGGVSIKRIDYEDKQNEI